MPKSFKPEKNLDEHTQDLLEKEIEKKQPPGLEALAIAVKEPVNPDEGTESKIYVWKPTMGKPLWVKKREHGHVKLCFYNNKLYDSAHRTLRNTLDNLEISTRNYRIFNLCVHNEDLIESDETGMVYKSFSEEPIINMKILLTSIYSYKDNLLMGDRRTAIYAYEKRRYKKNILKTVTERRNNVFAFCAHKGIIYDGSYQQIMKTYDNRLITTRDSWINTLCSYKNASGEQFLLDGGDYPGLYNTLTDEKIFDFEGWITSIIAIPKSIADELLYDSYGTTYVEPLC